MLVRIDQTTVETDRCPEIGSGGEAVVCKIIASAVMAGPLLPPNLVLKRYRRSDDRLYAGSQAQAKAAEARHAYIQSKLRCVPWCTLPVGVVRPMTLALDPATQLIAGFMMPFVAGASLEIFRDPQTAGRTLIARNLVIEKLRQLHELLVALHRAHFMVGDLNPRNVIVPRWATPVWLVDPDSIGHRGPPEFPCYAFTVEFVDPTICEIGPNDLLRLAQGKSYSAASDWFSFMAIAMTFLTGAGPYDGVHVAKPGGWPTSEEERMLGGISVLSPGVLYPSGPIGHGLFPEELIHVLVRAFEHKERVPMPFGLLEDLRWVTCTSCGLAHARTVCPKGCKPVAVARAAPKVTKIEIRETVVQGEILAAASHGRLRLLVRTSNDILYREGNQQLRELFDPWASYRICGITTAITKGDELRLLIPNRAERRFPTDGARAHVCDTNATNVFWLYNGQVHRDGVLKPSKIGVPLGGRPALFVGDTFGLVLQEDVRASPGQPRWRAYVFAADGNTLCPVQNFPDVTESMTVVSVAFAEKQCWLRFAGAQQGAQTLLWNVVIGNDGSVKAAACATVGSCTWLSPVGGGVALRGSLLQITSRGIVRVTVEHARCVEKELIPDTAQLAAQGWLELLLAPAGLYLVRKNGFSHLVSK